MNNPATTLLKANPNHIPKSNPAGISNADLFSGVVFSLCFFCMIIDMKLKVAVYVAIFISLASFFLTLFVYFS